MVPELQEFVMNAIESENNNKYTCIPCVVVAIRDDLSGQMVDIQPTINQLFQDGTVKERPVVGGVPVSFQLSKTAGFTFPINVGDTGTAIFSMRSMEAWKSGNGKPAAPSNFAKMDKSDAIFIPGIQPPGMASNNPGKHVLAHSTKDTVVFANLGGAEAELRIKADGSIGITTSNMPIIIEGSDVTINALSSLTLNTPNLTVDASTALWIGDLTFQGKITQTGDYSQTGNYVLNSININLHKHTGVVPGSGTSGTMV